MTSSIGWHKIQQQFFNVTTYSDQLYKIFNSNSAENHYCGNKWSYSVQMANGTYQDDPWFFKYFTYEGQRLVTIETPKATDVNEYWFRYHYKHSDYPNLDGYDSFNLTIFNPR